MKKAKKVLLILLCALLLVCASVAGTVAYLTDTKSVTNTFTTGNVAITLQENEMDVETGKVKKAEGADKPALVDEIKDIKIIPGREIEKQPVITVGSGSENCWLFVKVEGTNNILAAGAFVPAAGWSAVADNAGWYQCSTEKKAGDVTQVFEHFKVNNLDNQAVTALEDATITVTAYGIQAEGVNQADALTIALNMASSQNTTNP